MTTWTIRMPMYKAPLDKVSRGRNLPPIWAAFFMAGEKPGEMEAICSSFLPLLILCRPLLWLSALAWACGALSISWRATARTTLVPMLMCGKVTNDNLIDSSHYFRNTDQYEKLMWGFSYISFCLSKHFGESDVFVSFLLTASL